MKVDVWSDVVCPWCWIGKRRMEAAIAEFEHGDEIEVEWHSFELDPSSPPEHKGEYASRLARKYGMDIEQAHASIDRLTNAGAEDGLEFRFDQARSGNTFDAHRLIHLALDRGVQDAVKERLMRAYFNEGELISDHDTLVRVSAEAGLDADEARVVLEGDKYGEEVRADEATAQELGVTGVPFFVVDRKFAIAGAQRVDTMVSVLQRAWSKSQQTEVVAGAEPTAGENCDDGSCAI